jgi:hypothetical protein
MDKRGGNRSSSWFSRELVPIETIFFAGPKIARNGMPAKSATRDRRHPARWSNRVTRESNALDLKARVFTWHDPRRIARSLQRSAAHSARRRGTSYQSAMSMLNFYINRGGRNLSAERRRVLARAKVELRRLHDKSMGQKQGR